MAGLHGVIDRLVEASESTQQERVVAVRGRVARCDLERALKVALGGPHVDGKERLGPAEGGVPLGQARIERDRALRRFERRPARLGRRQERGVAERGARFRQARVGGRIHRIERDRLFEALARAVSEPWRSANLLSRNRPRR